MMLAKDSAIFECWTTLSALGMSTRKLRLCALGLTPEFRNAALSAKMVATLDNITNGRFEYLMRGIWTPDSFGVNLFGVPTSGEFDAYNVPWDAPEIKIERATELVELSQRLWNEEKVSHHGKYYQVKDAVCNPKPAQRPRPPIFIEGDEELHSLRLAAKVDGWCGAGPPTLMGRKVGVVKNYCKELGTDQNRMRHAWLGYVLTGRSASHVEEKIRQIRALNPKYPFDQNEFLNENIFGAPEQCISKVKQFVDAGVNYFATFFLDYPSTESMEIFAKHVLPSFRR